MLEVVTSILSNTEIVFIPIPHEHNNEEEYNVNSRIQEKYKQTRK